MAVAEAAMKVMQKAAMMRVHHWRGAGQVEAGDVM